MADRIKIEGASADVFREAPRLNGLRTAAIGRFRCKSLEAGQGLLSQICADLKSEGVEAVVGPMDGDTWHAYRLVTESDGSPNFLMEPTSGPHDLTSFEAAGFSRVSEYISARQPLAEISSASPADQPDVQIEAWDGSNPEGFFTEVHSLSLQAFAKNPFYQPIALEDFLAIYVPLVPMIRRELILFARSQDHSLQGFFFVIPDYQQGPQPQDVIFKTYASLIPGIGRMLLTRALKTSLELGFRNAIHALMHADNLSADRSNRVGGEIFRRYALMGRVLNA